ncbi:MAG TPA: type II secretion system F family protein [Candidatus Synoicihabitans sp.]|nr:type II secretion system F family protein [Candidatus Synoicihabitans sp.]
MPRYRYSAIDARSGQETQGAIESANSEAAAAQLKASGLFPTQLELQSAAVTNKLAAGTERTGTRGKIRSLLSWRSRRVLDRKGLGLFTRQLATLLKARMPLVRALDVLARQQRSPAARTAITQVADTIRGGGTLSEGLRLYPKTFDDLYVNMIKAGEAGAALNVVLERLARFLEKGEKIRGKVKAALTYPVIILVVAIGIVAALMVFVIPKFQGIFQSLLKGQSLPWLTDLVLHVSGFVQHHVIATLLMAGGAYAGLAAVKRTAVGRRIWDWCAIRLPVIGELGLKTSIARFTRTLGTLLSSGVPILSALVITRDTSGNVHVARALSLVHDRVEGGEGIAGPLEAAKLFPPMVTSMIEVGEETGALPEMLTRIADTYEDEVDNAVGALTSVLEPIMIVVMALMVGTIVVALFLPIIRIIQSLS